MRPMRFTCGHERTRVGGVRRRLDPVGDAVPVHQDRRRRRRAAGVPGVGAGGARRGGAARAGVARAAPLALADGAAGAGSPCSRSSRSRLPFPLIAAGEQHVELLAGGDHHRRRAAVRRPAGAARSTPSERATGARLGRASLLGLAGVVALMGIDVAGQPDELLGGAARSWSPRFCYAVGPMVLKRHFADLDPRASMGAALAVAAIVLAAARSRSIRRRPVPSGSALRLAGRARAALHRGGVRRSTARSSPRSGPGRALVITYVAPVVAVALGVAVLGRAPRRGRRGRAAADPGRLVAVDRRPAAAGPRRARDAAQTAPGAPGCHRPRKCEGFRDFLIGRPPLPSAAWGNTSSSCT